MKFQTRTSCGMGITQASLVCLNPEVFFGKTICALASLSFLTLFHSCLWIYQIQTWCKWYSFNSVIRDV